MELLPLVKSDCSQLVDKVRSRYDSDCVSLEQLARCFLFYLLSAIIFLNALGTGFLRLLPVLRDLRSLPKYSLGTTAFAFMYEDVLAFVAAYSCWI